MVKNEAMEKNESRIAPKILVIDDDPMQVQWLVQILKGENYDIIGYNDSVKALADAKHILPDLILLDLIMPQMNGFEICRLLKADNRTRHIPVIFVTAQNDQESESEGFKFGAVDYVTKPFNPVVIKARIRTHLELKRHRDALAFLVRQRTTERDKSRKQFQDLVEKSLVGIAIVQRECIVYQNPELIRTVTGLTEKILKKEFDFIHSDHIEPLKIAYFSLKEGKTNMVQTDIQILSSNRTGSEEQYKWFNCRASTFNYQGDEAILINLVDITHTKELEKRLLNRNKMASLGRIASGMAHEIRNPLSGITAYLYTMEQLCSAKTMAPKDVTLIKEIVNQLKLAAHKVDAVIKRVLDFSKPTTPRMAMIDISQCLNSVIGLTAVTMRKDSIQVNTDIAPNLPVCYGDPTLIEQLFLNLIQNASRALRKTTRPKKVVIQAKGLYRQISISISDSGPGVPEEIKDKIFDPFFTTHQDGSGIGLSIAQRIITDHNGTLNVGSSELGGAQFTVLLPIEKRKFPR